MNRQTQITILGNPRIPDASALPTQVLTADARGLHGSSFPLPTTTVEFPSWQNPAGGASAAAAAASPFYNLHRFSGYYQFPQINPAYLQTLWPQPPWQSSAAAQQIQQHQLQHQHQKQQQHPLMQSNAVETPWIGASLSSDLHNSSSSTAASSFHPPASQQISQTQPLSAARPVNVGTAQSSTSVSGFSSNFTPGMMPTTTNILSSFQSMYQQQQPSTSVAAGITSNSNSAALAANFPLATAANAVPSQFPVPFSTAANISAASSVANVKRMECDSSVPSPPKTQHQQQPASALTSFPQRATTSATLITESRSTTSNNFVPPVSKTSKTNTAVVAEQIKEEPVKTDTVDATPKQVCAKELPSAASVPSTSFVVVESTVVKKESDDKHKEPKSKVEEAEDEEVSSHPDSPSSTAEDVAVKQEPWKDLSRSRSPSHQSPKRRGHGHSESSRSLSPLGPSTPEVVVKKYRKSNEVARLLNDLTEGAWMNLAGRSSNRHSSTSAHNKSKNGNGQQNSDEDSSDESEEEEEDDKKKKKKPVTQNKTPANDQDKPKRGRPKGSGKKQKAKKIALKVSRAKQESESASANSSSDESEVSEKSRPRKVGRPSTASRGESHATPVKRGRKPGSSTATNSASPKKRGRPPTKPPPRLESDSEESSSSSASSSVSSFSPRHSRVTTPKQRKVGTAPTTSARRTAYSGRGGKASAKRGPVKRVGRPLATDKRGSVKRSKKNSSSSPESASEESSSEEDEAPNRRSFDRSAFHNPEEQCGARLRCKMPQGSNVNWIQCDFCDTWFHRDCITDEVDENSDFHCGCKKNSKKRGRKSS